MTFEFRNRLSPEVEASMQALYKTFSEKDRRRFAAFQSQQLGHGSMAYLAEVLDCSRRTIERGKQELQVLPEVDPAAGRVRRVGGGRKKNCARQ